MIIAAQKKKENIAEYLIYMYQVEDMIRANRLDLDEIERTLISKFEVPYEVKRDMREWYKNLIAMMRDEQKVESGHLNILERSKALCEYLIVGVSTDELIEKEKGRRPVIPYEERARVLEAISFVDQVIPQVDKDKQKVVDTYRIDAISVGDDWKGRYPKVSCQMEYFPYTKSISSTILKDTLNLTLHPKA